MPNARAHARGMRPRLIQRRRRFGWIPSCSASARFGHRRIAPASLVRGCRSRAVERRPAPEAARDIGQLVDRVLVRDHLIELERVHVPLAEPAGSRPRRRPRAPRPRRACRRAGRSGDPARRSPRCRRRTRAEPKAPAFGAPPRPGSRRPRGGRLESPGTNLLDGHDAALGPDRRVRSEALIPDERPSRNLKPAASASGLATNIVSGSQ